MTWCVIVDWLTKSAHFLAVRMTFTLEEFYRLYIREIVRLHGVPISIVLDRGPKFTTHFWENFQQSMGTRLMMSTAFHPQTDGQSERTIQTLKDMLWACVLDLKGSCEEHLPLMEFAYNNVIRRAYKWHPMRHYMGGRVDLQLVGRMWEIEQPQVQILLETPLRRQI